MKSSNENEDEIYVKRKRKRKRVVVPNEDGIATTGHLHVGNPFAENLTEEHGCQVMTSGIESQSRTVSRESEMANISAESDGAKCSTSIIRKRKKNRTIVDSEDEDNNEKVVEEVSLMLGLGQTMKLL